MKTSERVIFVESLQIAQSRTTDDQLVEKFIDALIREGYRFSRQAIAWRVGSLPNNETRVQVEFDGHAVHFIHLGNFKGHNSFPLEPDASFPLNTEDHIPLAVSEFGNLFHRKSFNAEH